MVDEGRARFIIAVEIDISDTDDLIDAIKVFMLKMPHGAKWNMLPVKIED